MDFPKSVPSAGLVDGKFVDEDALTGTPGSLIPAAWGNSITLEVLHVIEAAGLAPDEDNNAQLLAAIRLLGKQAIVLNDTGAVNAYTAVNTPALVAQPGTGYLQKVKIANANTGASTYAPDGLAAKPLYGLGLQPLQGGELPVGVAVLMYLVQASVNGGSGAWVVIESLGGAAQVAPATKSQHAVNAGQVQAQRLTAFTSAGAAPAFTLTPSPAIDAYAAPLRFRVKFHTAGTGADTMNVSGQGAKSLKQYDSTGNKVAAVIAPNQLTDVEYDGVDLVVLDPLPTSVLQVGIQGAAKNLVGWADGLNSTVNYWLDEQTVEDGGGNYKTGRNLLLAINLATLGANGLDVGAVAANSWYSTWGIFNPTTNTWAGIAALCPVLTGNTTAGSAIVTGLASTASMRAGMPVSGGSLPAGATIKSVDSGSQVTLTKNATSVGVGVSLRFAYDPVLPGGYTSKARVGMILTDGTANKYPLGFSQSGRAVSLLNEITIATGTGTGVAASVDAVCPITAGVVLATMTGTSTGVQQNQVGPTPAFVTDYSNTPVSGTPNKFTFRMVLFSRNIYWGATLGGRLAVYGWEDNL